jgi:hypothetical protein
LGDIVFGTLDHVGLSPPIEPVDHGFRRTEEAAGDLPRISGREGLHADMN